MIKFNFDINKSKKFLFLDVLVYLSIFSLLAGPSLLNFSTILLVIIFFLFTKEKIIFKFFDKIPLLDF